MKLYQKILATGALITSLGLSGCKTETLEGTVKEEFGTLAQRIVESSSGIFGNDSVKFGNSTYGLILETDKGKCVINVVDCFKKPVEALAKMIEPGDKIRIEYDSPFNLTSDAAQCYTTHIDRDCIGTTDSSTIKLIEKAKK